MRRRRLIPVVAVICLIWIVAALSAPASAASPEPKPEGELKVSMSFPTFTPDPMLHTSTAKCFMSLIHSWLIGQTPDAKMSADTGVAKKWETSPDFKTWTFYLREGIKFHNGDEITAEDVKFSIERVLGPRSISSVVGVLREYVDKVEVAGRYKVVVHTKVPGPDLGLYLSAVIATEGIIVPKKYIEEKGADYFLKYPIGGGPYKVKEIVLGSHMVLEALDKHWKVGVPRYKTVVLKHVPEEGTRIAQLKTREADVINVAEDKAVELAKAGYDLVTKEDDMVLAFIFHEMWDKDSPLADLKVREALNIGINREEIAKTLFWGQAKPWGAFLAPPDPTYDKKLFPPFPYDPTKAKRLVQEYGRPVRMKLYAFPRFPQLKSLAEAVAGYWGKIGVEVEIVPMDYDSFRKLWIKGATGMKPVLGGRGVGAACVKDHSTRYSYYATDAKLLRSGTTMCLWSNPKDDELIDRIGTEINPERRHRIEQQWQKYKYDNFLYPGIVTSGWIFAKVKGVKAWKFPAGQNDMGIENLISRD